TTNMLGKTLRQYCPTDSAMAKEQRRIEKELEAFEKNLWGDQVRKDSLDSISKANADVKTSKKKTKKNRRSGTTTVKEKPAKRSSSSGSASPRVTVRRQRH
ncbi:MAG: gliding motility protein GldN, partial [Prevotella sp.]|nr:gliding motility protein GldN [Prevotella sp.]